LCTYYIYDDLNNLRFVIPPKAVAYLQAHGWTVTQDLAYGLCFRYVYAGRRRMIIKQVPGARQEQMVYDLRDRLVFSQDGNERDLHQWQVTWYDGLNRPVETGLYDTTIDRETLQSRMNAVAGTSGAITYSVPAPGDLTLNARAGNTPATYTARNSITFLPGFTSGTSDAFSTTLDSNALGSSGTLLPADATNPAPPVAMASITPLTYSFYDDYGWSGAQAFQASYLSKVTDGGNSYKETPSSYSYKTRGLVTGTLVRVLGAYFK
jgi:hypothetical protein